MVKYSWVYWYLLQQDQHAKGSGVWSPLLQIRPKTLVLTTDVFLVVFDINIVNYTMYS